MNIVFIGPFGWQPKATMRTRALGLGQALAAKGHTVTMLLPPWDDPDRAGRSWQDGGVQVVNTPLPPGVPGLFQVMLTRSLASRAVALQPDVIHFFKPKAYAGLAHWVLLRRRRWRRWPVRLVLDSDDWEQAWNDISPYPAAHKRFFTWQEQWGLSHADAVTVASRELERLVKPYTGRRPVAYTPNGWSRAAQTGLPAGEAGVDLEGAARVRRTWGLGEAPVILLYSRFVEFRLERIVSQIELIAAQVPEARWLIVGQGLHGEEKRLETMLDQAGLTEFARFTGWLPLAETPAYFQTAAVTIYPYDETVINRTKCSVKLISLLAAGLPVVADAVGQNCEYIRSGVTGILTPPEDDIAFSQAVVTLLRAPAMRRRLGQAAARSIPEKFDWFHLSRTVEEVYHDSTSFI